MTDVDAHNEEIQRNLDNWKRKPLLREIYRSFHETIAAQLTEDVHGPVVEVGSGVANISEVIPDCIRTDIFPNPWIDQVENAYALSFQDESISNLILFDVFHHLRYPGTALREFHRIIVPAGRIIIFEPDISLLGRIVYGPLHDEPIAMSEPIQWLSPEDWQPTNIDYYAAQGNASRIFRQNEVDVHDTGWNIITLKRYSSISYVASGGYSGPQLYPRFALPLMRIMDSLLNFAPQLFSTRLLVVLEKN